jgi:excisionase family DNA binding protein
MTDIAPPGPLKEILTVAEAAELLGVSKKTVRRLAIPKARLGRNTIRYLREDVVAYIRRMANVRGAA